MVVTGWSPTAEEEEEMGGRGVGREAAEGASWGPGIAVVGMTVEEREVVEEVGETDGRSEETSLAVGAEEGGEDKSEAAWIGGGEVSIVGGMLEGKVEGTEVAMTAGTV